MTQKKNIAPIERESIVKARLAASLSGFVLRKRFSIIDKRALHTLAERGEVELIETGAGRAYRLRKAEESR